MSENGPGEGEIEQFIATLSAEKPETEIQVHDATPQLQEHTLGDDHPSAVGHNPQTINVPPLSPEYPQNADGLGKQEGLLNLGSGGEAVDAQEGQPGGLSNGIPRSEQPEVQHQQSAEVQHMQTSASQVAPQPTPMDGEKVTGMPGEKRPGVPISKSDVKPGIPSADMAQHMQLDSSVNAAAEAKIPQQMLHIPNNPILAMTAPALLMNAGLTVATGPPLGLHHQSQHPGGHLAQDQDAVGQIQIVNPPTAAGKKRKRVRSGACAACHARKLRCEEKKPCFRCKKHKIECVPRAVVRRGKRQATRRRTPVSSPSAVAADTAAAAAVAAVTGESIVNGIGEGIDPRKMETPMKEGEVNEEDKYLSDEKQKIITPKRLADKLNPHRGVRCYRNPKCTRPNLHPGHCKIYGSSLSAKKGPAKKPQGAHIEAQSHAQTQFQTQPAMQAAPPLAPVQISQPVSLGQQLPTQARGAALAASAELNSMRPIHIPTQMQKSSSKFSEEWKKHLEENQITHETVLGANFDGKTADTDSLMKPKTGDIKESLKMEEEGGRNFFAAAPPSVLPQAPPLIPALPPPNEVPGLVHIPNPQDEIKNKLATVKAADGPKSHGEMQVSQPQISVSDIPNVQEDPLHSTGM